MRVSSKSLLLWITTSILTEFFFLFQENSCQEWCQAVHEVGKSEYAECLEEGNDVAKYIIQTVPLSSSGVNLYSNVSLILSNGHGLRTKEITISNETEGVLNKVLAIRSDIGNPEHVHLKLNSTHKNWRCKKITVWKDFKYWIFDCIDLLNDKKPEATYFLSGTKLYVAYIQTGKDHEAGTTSSIEITLLGGDKRSNTKTLYGGFTSGSLKKIKFQASDVGNLEDIILTNKASNDPWYCDSVKIKSGRKIFMFNVKSWIGYPYEKSVKVNIRSDNIEGAAKDIDCNVRGSDMINLDHLPSTLANKLQIFKVRCPQNCHVSDFSKVEGSNVHPASTSICASALHDGTLSPSGGHIIVTVGSDLTNYHAIGEPFNGITAIDFSTKADEKNFSFYTYHLDSIDDIKSDVRIVDTFGKLSSLGRLEIRVNNKWGSICKKGPSFVFTDDSAKRACKDLGFPNGIYIKENCGLINGQNYCAGYGYPFSGAGVLCSGNEKNLLQCNTDKPTNCVDHNDDVIVQCLEFSSNHIIADGTIRIVDVNGSPSNNGVGRLQIYYHNSFGSVCSEGWLKESEHIACLELGYKGIKGNGLSHHLCSNISGENLCGHDTEKINAVNFRCKGSEHKLKDCPHDSHEDIYCSHDEDIIISCAGEGDSSGIGLSGHKNILKLEKKSFPQKIELTCFDKILSKSDISNAHVGDIFLASCPEKCDEEAGIVKGTFIYTFDTPICKAAIHAGALNSNTADDIIITIGHKHKNFIGTKRNGIDSRNFNGTSQSYQVSIPTISILNEERKNSAKIDKDETLVTATVAENTPSIFNESGKAIRNYIQPNFQWIAPTGFIGFNGKETDFVDCSNLPNAKYIKGMSNFTFIIYFTVSGGDRTWRTLLSHSACEGISISVDEENELIVEHNCNPKLIKTGFKPQLGESNHMAIVFNKSTKTVIAYVNGKKVVFIKGQYDFTLNGDLFIGRSSKSTTDYFIGNIHLVEVYKYALSEEEIKDSFNLVTSLEYININATDTTRLKKKSGKRKTVDGRECITPCKPKYVISKNLQANTDVISLKCSDDLFSDQFNGKIGSQFLVTCTENCLKYPFLVKGTNNHYTPDSSICRAAIHAGVYLPNKKKKNKEKEDNTFIVRIVDGLLEYKSSRGHYGIISKPEKQSQLRSFSVFSQKEDNILTCSNDAQFVSNLSVGSSLTISCPSRCDETNDKVFGTNIYSPLSSVCKAAIHSGILSKAGGQVELVVGAKQTEFKGSTQNNIESLDSTENNHSITFARHIE